MIIKGLSLLFLGFGIFALMQVVSPFLEFKAFEIFAFEQNSILTDPHPESGGEVAGVSIENVGDFPAFMVKGGQLKNMPYSDFYISIPSINLGTTKVYVNTNEFDTYLAQLPGTALPGEKGNVFITGHSNLPNEISKNKSAYFVDLPKVKKGDLIFADALGQRFTYEVIGMKIVDPKEVSVITSPDLTGRYMSLMTCVPPGFNTKRLVVLTRLKT